MIKTYSELRRVIKLEKKNYYNHAPYHRLYIADAFVKESYVEIWKYQRLMRITEYFYNNRNSIIHCLIYFLVARKKNKKAINLGIFIPNNVFGEGLIIDHYGSIVVNGAVRIGKNARLHGENCIGNKGAGRECEYPSIGDNLDMGIGSKIIGGVRLGDNIKIGANAVVTKSFIEGNASLIGVPAHTTK